MKHISMHHAYIHVSGYGSCSGPNEPLDFYLKKIVMKYLWQVQQIPAHYGEKWEGSP